MQHTPKLLCDETSSASSLVDSIMNAGDYSTQAESLQPQVAEKRLDNIPFYAEIW